MKDALIQALVYLVQAVIIVIGTFLGLFLRRQAQLLKAKIGNESFFKLVAFTQEVVKAMEQIYGKGTGEKKKQEAVQFLVKHFKLDEKTAEILVEAAVHEMNKVLKEIK